MSKIAWLEVAEFTALTITSMVFMTAPIIAAGHIASALTN